MHRILVVGTGSIGERHVRCFLATGRASIGICEPHEHLRLAVAHRYPLEHAVAGLDEALASDWDAAVIATPANLHIPIAVRLAQSKINLLIEKPLSTSLEGVAELETTVGTSGVRAAVAYVYRVHPLIQSMSSALRSGGFGLPLELVVQTGHDFPAARPAYQSIYYSKRETGGGAIQDALTHMLDAGQYLVGPIERITADASHQLLLGVEVEDTVHATARHGAVLASYSLNQYQPATEVTLTVVCERGMLRAEVHENRWRWMKTVGEPWHEETLPPLERDAWFTLQASAFLDYLEGKREAPCSLAEGIHTLRVNLAALHSADHGGIPVNVPRT